MRMDALAEVIQRDNSVKKVYLLNQDYSFGHDVSREAQRALKERRPDIAIVGDEFHPIGRVKDFAPYVAKIRASGADAVDDRQLGQRPDACSSKPRGNRA